MVALHDVIWKCAQTVLTGPRLELSDPVHETGNQRRVTSTDLSDVRALVPLVPGFASSARTDLTLMLALSCCSITEGKGFNGFGLFAGGAGQHGVDSIRKP